MIQEIGALTSQALVLTEYSARLVHLSLAGQDHVGRILLACS